MNTIDTMTSQMKHRFVYNDVNHTYTWDDRPMTGVTTILNQKSKPALIPWASKECAEYVWANRLRMYDGEITLAKLLTEAKDAHNLILKEAGSLGSKAHKWCEEYDRGLKPKATKEIKELVEGYVNWKNENVEKVLFMERPLFSPELFVAGTPDKGLQLKDGKNLIGDHKFTSGIYGRGYFAQMAGYRKLIEDMKAIQEPTEVVLEWAETTETFTLEEYLKPLDNEYSGGVILLQTKPVDNEGRLFSKRPVKPKFSAHYSYDYETDLKYFMSCLDLYRSDQTYEKK